MSTDWAVAGSLCAERLGPGTRRTEVIGQHSGPYPAFRCGSGRLETFEKERLTTPPGGQLVGHENIGHLSRSTFHRADSPRRLAGWLRCCRICCAEWSSDGSP